MISWKQTSNYCSIWISQSAYMNLCAFLTSELFDSFRNFKIRGFLWDIISSSRISLANLFASGKLMLSSFKYWEVSMQNAKTRIYLQLEDWGNYSPLLQDSPWLESWAKMISWLINLLCHLAVLDLTHFTKTCDKV